MAKIKKVKKRRRLKKNAIFLLVFLFSLSCFLASSIFVKAYKYSLNTQINEVQTKIANAELQQAALQQDIKQLTNKDAVVGIAEQDGLSNLKDNVTYITQGE